jgi:hypothetical protein
MHDEVHRNQHCPQTQHDLEEQKWYLYAPVRAALVMENT